MTFVPDANVLLKSCPTARPFSSVQAGQSKQSQRPARSSLSRRCHRPEFLAKHLQVTKRSRTVLSPQASASGWDAAVDSGVKGVRVFQVDHLQKRRIYAEVKVQASIQQIWRVITDYDHLADFVPNLVSSERLPTGSTGRIHLRQRGCSQSLFWRLEAEAVLECVEVQKQMGARELKFRAIQGDFKEYSGSWIVESDPYSNTNTLLKYEISLEPKLSIPSAIVTCVVKAGLPANMMAMAKRAEQVAEMKRKFPRFAASFVEEAGWDALPWQNPAAAASVEPAEQLPEAGPSRSICSAIHASDQNDHLNRGYLGLISVPIPMVPPENAVNTELGLQPAVPPQAAGSNVMQPLTSVGPHSALPPVPWGRSPDLGPNWKLVSDASAITEVHLRRLDAADQLHRRVVAVLTIDAPPEAVWRVLTDYERLPEIVPNLAVCERVKTPTGMSKRVTRLRQVGYKYMLYMSMHAEAIVDLVETQFKEVQFRQVQGDFSLLQGKFMLQKAESERRFVKGKIVTGPQTHLKYAVEVQIPRGPLRLLGLVEPIIERMVYEDLPLNLGAIKQRVEEIQQRMKLQELEAQGDLHKAAILKRQIEAPPDADLQKDIKLLAVELNKHYGATRKMPTRAELRADNRGYLERAIAAHGGHGIVAGLIGWEVPYLPKRPRGYWNNLANIKSAVDEFAEANGLPPGTVPQLRDLRAADRADLARAVEKWGGVNELAQELGYGIAPRVTSSEGSGTIRVHANPASVRLARVHSIAMAAKEKENSQAQGLQARLRQMETRQSTGELPSRPVQSPADAAKREKQPILKLRQRLELRRKTPKLPSMRQEIDDW